ncbi:MAG: hypothetical protein HFI48_00025 [Lachnospiraceae bacterium]|nr:hypothetical protein [Lachnospiraceae bacterium]
MSEKQNYLRQIEKFYNGSLKSNQVIKIGNTPEYLIRLGAKPLSIVMKQSTLAKCIRKPKGSKSAHDLDRTIIETLPDQLLSPILVVNEAERKSFAIITDYKDKNGNNMLIALKLESNVQNMTVNEIASFYGRNNLEVYLNKHRKTNIHIIDNKKAKTLASLLRLQLPTTLQEFDYKNNISLQNESVNSKFSVLEKLCENRQKVDFSKNSSKTYDKHQQKDQRNER